MEKLLIVAINDFKLVFRDTSLRFFFIFPILNLLVVRFGIPIAIENFPVLKDYVSLILMATTTQGALIFGFIYSMVLIDEKDTNVSKVYGVLPVSKFWFVLFRLISPYFFSTIATFLILIVEPFYGISYFENIIFSMLIGLVAPQMVLFVAIMSKNKLEGMTWQKLFNAPINLPILTFIVPAWFSFFFAFFPTYWAFQGFYQIILGKGYNFYFLVGYIYFLLTVAVLAQRFTKNHFD